MLKNYLIPILLIITLNQASGQILIKSEFDKCGSNPLKEKALHMLYGDNWGYSYDSLLNDINIWEANDFIQINSIGQSTLGNEIFELTITNFDDTKDLKHRIYIHARTHPGEVQSYWVAKEIIKLLSDDTEIGTFMLDKCIFHIVPMYNPDGVILEYPRENANGIDIESNWNAEVPEVEVFNLKNRFFELMQEENPIEIALNMHSAYACERYFVYHHENGTSAIYADLEENFIESIRDHFLSGIQAFDYYVSWTNSTPTQYPESWWWMNYEDQVMALTYEDMNCESAGFYNKTAYATLYGISDYLNLGYVFSPEKNLNNQLKAKTYPNPFTVIVKIEWNNFDVLDAAFITDIYGRLVYSFSKFELSNNYLIWSGENAKGNKVMSGVYFLNLIIENQNKSLKLIKQ